MANSVVWEILWVVAAVITGGVMFGAWTGPHRSVSNLSRWAVQMRLPYIPAWLRARAADRWAFRGGLVSLVLLLAAAWLVPPQRGPDLPVGIPSDVDSSKGPVAPATPGASRPAIPQRPDRHLDADLKNAILVHVPKTKQVRIVVLRDDPEADQFSWEIDAFLRSQGYTVISPRLFFAMAPGGQMPSGTSMYPDEKDPNIVVIRIGLNDRG
jgi:hypothetical protein